MRLATKVFHRQAAIIKCPASNNCDKTLIAALEHPKNRITLSLMYCILCMILAIKLTILNSVWKIDHNEWQFWSKFSSQDNSNHNCCISLNYRAYNEKAIYPDWRFNHRARLDVFPLNGSNAIIIDVPSTTVILIRLLVRGGTTASRDRGFQTPGMS